MEGSLKEAAVRVDEAALSERAGHEVRATMVASCSCVSEGTAKWLDAAAAGARDGSRQGSAALVGSTPYGWIASVVEAGSPGTPADLAALLRDAASKGCSYVLLDRDAGAVEGLPVFDW